MKTPSKAAITRAKKKAAVARGELINKKWKADTAKVDKWKKPCDSCNAEGECLTGPYSKLKEKCNGEIHHIIPDAAYRNYERNDDTSYKIGETKAGKTKTRQLKSGLNKKKRLKGAPTLNEGETICLSEEDHKKVHKKIADRIKEKQQADADWGKNGVIPLEELSEISQKALIDVVKEDKNSPPDEACAEKANAAVDNQTALINDEKVHMDMNKVPEDLDQHMNLVPL